MFRNALDGLPRVSRDRLELLEEIVYSCDRLQDSTTPDRAALAAKLSELLDRFQRGRPPKGDSRGGPLPSDNTLSSFYTALMSLPNFSEMPGARHFDTAGSRVMGRYRTDYSGALLFGDQIAAALGLDPDRISSLDDYLTESREKLLSVQQVMDALRQEAGLRLDAPRAGGTDQAVLDLFRKVYPACDLRPEEVRLYWTRCTAHFAVFVEDTRGRDFSDFWDSVSGFRFPYFDHFPMFGFLDTDGSDHDWLVAISERSGEPIARTRRILDSSLMALKGETLDKYLLHDIWGHRWQGIFTRWKEFYDQLKLQDEALVATESWSWEGQSVPFGVLLSHTVDGGEVRWSYDPAALQTWLLREAEERITLAFTQILSELTADLIEDKYRQIKGPADPDLNNSSWLPDLPCKADFSLTDLRRIWESIFAPFQDVRRKARVMRKSIFEAHRKDLADRVSRESLWKSLDPLVEDLVRDIESFHTERLQTRITSGSLYGLAAANVLDLHGVLNRLCAEEERTDRRLCEGYRDLLCLFIAQYFERNPVRNFWVLDEMLDTHFTALVGKARSTVK